MKDEWLDRSSVPTCPWVELSCVQLLLSSLFSLCFLLHLLFLQFPIILANFLVLKLVKPHTMEWVRVFLILSSYKLSQQIRTGLGACGITSSDSDSVTAISALIFDNYPYGLISSVVNVCILLSTKVATVVSTLPPTLFVANRSRWHVSQVYDIPSLLLFLDRSRPGEYRHSYNRWSLWGLRDHRPQLIPFRVSSPYWKPFARSGWHNVGLALSCCDLISGLFSYFFPWPSIRAFYSSQHEVDKVVIELSHSIFDIRLRQNLCINISQALGTRKVKWNTWPE